MNDSLIELLRVECEVFPERIKEEDEEIKDLGEGLGQEQNSGTEVLRHLDSGYISKVRPTKFGEEKNVEYEKRSEEDTRVFGL